jgi:predicted transcriptional regulator
MSPVKEAAIKLIQSLPENCTFEDIQYHLYVREKVEAGIQAIEAGKILSEEEADRRITEWLESFGQNPH